MWEKSITILMFPLTIVTFASIAIAVYKARRNHWAKLLTEQELKYWESDFTLPDRFIKAAGQPGKISQFFSLIFLAASAIKYKMCPIITFK